MKKAKEIIHNLIPTCILCNEHATWLMEDYDGKEYLCHHHAKGEDFYRCTYLDYVAEAIEFLNNP